MNVHGKNDPLKFKDRCMDNPPYGLLSIIKIQLEFELEPISQYDVQTSIKIRNVGVLQHSLTKATINKRKKT